ncbi:MAG: trypsin-like peptidase domain-containing protein [Pseudanabaenaceae cyanobacterium]
MSVKVRLLGAISAALLGAGGVVPVALPGIAQATRTDEQIAIEVYRKANPAVVTVLPGNGNGSGSIIDSRGLVLTNEHVVRFSDGTVRVRLEDGRTYVGDIIAVDRRSDLALIRLRTNGTERFPTIPLADPKSIAVGQRVFAIGAPFGLSGTLTTGILSRISPRNGDLQSDAVLNPGSSGGPLLNSRGELIGVNKAIRVTPSGGNTGISFSTSVGAVRSFVAQNANNPPIARVPEQPRRGVSPDRPRLGVTVNTDTLIIESVQPGSIASRVGLRPGDRLLALNGRRLEDVQELIDYLDSRPQVAILTVARSGRVGNLRIVF